MMWFGTDFFAVLGCSRLDFWTFQGVDGMAEPFKSAAPLSVPRRVKSIGFNILL